MKHQGRWSLIGYALLACALCIISYFWTSQFPWKKRVALTTAYPKNYPTTSYSQVPHVALLTRLTYKVLLPGETQAVNGTLHVDLVNTQPEEVIADFSTASLFIFDRSDGTWSNEISTSSLINELQSGGPLRLAPFEHRRLKAKFDFSSRSKDLNQLEIIPLGVRFIPVIKESKGDAAAPRWVEIDKAELDMQEKKAEPKKELPPSTQPVEKQPI